MARLYELVGEGTWTDLLRAVSAHPSPAPTHPYAACPHRSRCPEHRRAYRRLLKAAKASVLFQHQTALEQALHLLAHHGHHLSDSALTDLALIARCDPNPTRLESQSRGDVLQTMARRVLYAGGKL